MSDPGPPPLPGSPTPPPAAPVAAPPGPPGSGPAKKGLPTWAWVAIGCGGIMLLGLIALVVLGVFIFSWGRGALEDATGERSLSDIVESLEDNPARTIAETAIRMDSELELISTDDDAGTITFRSSETGEEATLNFQDIAEGRFAMTTPDGDFSVDAAAAAVDAVGAVGHAGGGVTFSGPDGQVRLGANISLDELPDWVPVYPGSSDAQVPYMTSTDEGASGMLSGTTADSVQQVVDHYRDVFDDNGFTIANESSTQSGTTEFASITATSDDGSTVNAAATRQAGEDTQIVVMFAATDGR